VDIAHGERQIGEVPPADMQRAFGVIQADDMGETQFAQLDDDRAQPTARFQDQAVRLQEGGIRLNGLQRARVVDGGQFVADGRAGPDRLPGLTGAVVARAALRAGATPLPVYEKRRCEACSLIELCRPKALGKARSIRGWLARRIEEDGS
jgi:CRISPR-associated exonuclease Cas4